MILYKSIRFKITILYMAILALTLTSFSAILYHNVSRGLYGNMDTLLNSKAGGISKAIDTYWEASRLESQETATPPDLLLRKRRNINFAKIAQRWVKEESSDPALLDIIVQVFDTDGAIIASSKNTQGLTGISRKDFLSVLQGNPRFDTVSALRIFTTPVFENEKVAYIVQVASPLSAIETALNNLKVALFILFPVTVLATGIMGAFIAKVTLRPVDNMIKTIHEITAENMKLKLRIPGTKDEIQKLAETFNVMLERLDEAFTSQRQLFEDLSHELKTPLTILKGEFEVILKKIRSQGEYEYILKSSLEEVNRIIRLAEDLLLLARLDSKEVSPRKEKFDLASLIQGVVNNMKPLAELKEILASFNSKTGEIMLNGDKDQLKTVFLNMLDNAIKYTGPGGAIDVSLEKDESLAQVKIQDTGIGILQDELSRIFDRFYRVDKSRNSPGFGLGLSIARSIVEAHGGNIRAESRPDKGTTFIISLPLA